MTTQGQVHETYAKRRNERLDRFVALKSEVASVAEAAEAMGLKPRTLEKVLERARRAGDPRADRGSLPSMTQKGRKYAKPSRAKAGPTHDERVQEILDEWDFLRSLGTSIHEAAPRLGVAVSTLENYVRNREKANA